MHKKLLILLLIITTILTACIPKQDNAFKDLDSEKESEEGTLDEVSQKLEEKDQLQVLKDYYEAIEKDISEEELISSTRNNILKLDDNKVDEMLIQLESFLYSKGYDPLKVTEKLNPFVESTSDEYKSYFKIWKTETEKETTDGEGLNISAEEIIDRALEIERHSLKFSGNIFKEKLDDLFKAYISLSLKGLGNPYIFAKEGETTLSPDFLEMYKEKIDKNPETRTAQVLNMYIEELEKDSYNLNGDNVNYFYENIDNIIESTK